MLFFIISFNSLFASISIEYIGPEPGNQLAVKGGEDIECDCDPEVICYYWYQITITTDQAPRSANALFIPNEQKGWLDIGMGTKTTNPSGSITTTFISNPSTLQINASTVQAFNSILLNMP